MIVANIFQNSIAKLGNADDENEDSLGWIRQPKNGLKLKAIKCAIADGATQASFSRLWAHLLVRNAIQSGYTPSELRLRHLIDKSASEWEDEIGKKNLPWYAIEKARQGAFSSLLWSSITKRRLDNGGTLRAISAGDSELFVIRDSNLIEAFPVRKSEDFGSTPELISSKIHKNKILDYKKLFVEWEPGDDIILATDALAKYLLKQFEVGCNPVESIRYLLNPDKTQKDTFRDWISSLRSNGQIKNDDSTMVWIQLYEQEEFALQTE